MSFLIRRLFPPYIPSSLPPSLILQARPPADAFVGYGGVVVREKVAKGADWFVYNFEVGLQGEREGGIERGRAKG